MGKISKGTEVKSRTFMDKPQFTLSKHQELVNFYKNRYMLVVILSIFSFFLSLHFLHAETNDSSILLIRHREIQDKPVIAVIFSFTSSADEGAGSAGQTQRARPFLPLRRRAHRASVRQASPHGYRRLTGSSAESQRGRPVTHHLF